jgi:spore coat polysaccharide biosynthesis protein SpsF
MERLRIWAIVQARMSSRRLPGKVLAPLDGQPMLGCLIDRLSHARGLEGICVATSNTPSDDPIAAFCDAHAICCHRGELDDVAARLLAVAKELDADGFVRVNGDSPLLDLDLVTQAAEWFRRDVPDLVSNVLVRTFPKGQSVEVVNRSTMETALAHFGGAEEREHVTLHFYRNAERFRIVSFEHAGNVSHLQLSVDTAEDLLRVRDLYARFKRPHWSYGVDEIIEMLGDQAA